MQIQCFKKVAVVGRDTMNPVTLEILKNAFTAIPEEMGAALKRTAYSPNIKEWMDASRVHTFLTSRG